MPRKAEAVLGIDAAWTDSEPSGVALLQRCGAKWKSLRIAPSYAAFCDIFEWADRVLGGAVEVNKLLAACEKQLGGSRPEVIAVDMPLSITQINKRRCADRLVSRRFGHCKCAVHSPTAARPGPTGRHLCKGFADAGFALATKAGAATPALLEVYPHVALLGLTGRNERLPYKTGKTTTYWRGRNIEDRKRLLIGEWRFILDRLARNIDNINLPLPDPQTHSLQSLKRFEDAIDGLVCAWVATQYIDGAAVPLGNDDAVIWVPTTSMQFAKEGNAA